MLHFLELTTYMLLQSLLMIFFPIFHLSADYFKLISVNYSISRENVWKKRKLSARVNLRAGTRLHMSSYVQPDNQKTKDIYFKAKKGWKQQLCCLCLLVGLSAALLKNYRTDFLETWTEARQHELLMWIQMKGQTFSLLFLNLTAAANHGAHTFQDDHYF